MDASSQNPYLVTDDERTSRKIDFDFAIWDRDENKLDKDNFVFQYNVNEEDRIARELPTARFAYNELDIKIYEYILLEKVGEDQYREIGIIGFKVGGSPASQQDELIDLMEFLDDMDISDTDIPELLEYIDNDELDRLAIFKEAIRYLNNKNGRSYLYIQ